MKRYISTLFFVAAALTNVSAQKFFNLTASEVKIDSVLPVFTYQIDLGTHYADSAYEVTIDYPEFIDMSKNDIKRLKKITRRQLPELPQVNQYLTVSRKQGVLDVSFTPIVFRDGKYQKLVSFQLNRRAVAPAASRVGAKVVAPADRYAAHSVLASGTWAKICVPSTGVYQITNDLITAAGFSDPSKVKVYGYGGALQPEALTGDYLVATDDLKEVPTCTVNGHRLMYAVGPVNWNTSTKNERRRRNNYSQYGYYFLTESDGAPLTVDETTFLNSFYPSANDYHSLYEPEEYSWYTGGRNLFARTPLTTESAVECTLESAAAKGTLVINMSFNGTADAIVTVNNNQVGTITCRADDIGRNANAGEKSFSFTLDNLVVGKNTIALTKRSGNGILRLDYVMLSFDTPKAATNLQASQFPVPTFVHRITNQDLHSHTATDMVIVIPTSQMPLAQAKRLKELHEQKDGLRVRIIPADELYNEFSSGTPDANAYRRYLKMLYDRAQNDADMPRYLLLFGDCAWDNRMLVSEWSTAQPSDFLLCYESENSFSETDCYVSDDYFCLLDDGEEIESSSMGTSEYRYRGKPDVAVGRFTARTADQAKVLVDKTISYRNDEYAGAWQNTIMFMGDDGNQNVHMRDAESIANMINKAYPAYNIKKVYWDAYKRVTGSTGNTYPDVTRIIKQQMQEGALVMNYSGHGNPQQISHEKALWLSDFTAATSLRLPLWVTASCDIMPFDGQESNIGEAAMYNSNGGAIAFFGTTRTVYVTKNLNINRSFMKHLFSTVNGQRVSIGEAVRLAKNEMVTIDNPGIYGDQTANKLQYSLLGDPAVVLAGPTVQAQIDSINGEPVDKGTLRLLAGQTVKVQGSIPGYENFNGQVTATVRDVEEYIVCKRNDTAEAADTAFYFTDRPNTIFVGSDYVRDGKFSISFAVPKDISYSDDVGQILVYAVNDDHTVKAHGLYEDYVLAGEEQILSDGVGPSIYCYLNSSLFNNGGTVNDTPYFYAELYDKDGLNAAGNGIGHNMELIIDGDMKRTYDLTNYFEYDFGDYRSGRVGFSIPTLAEGAHKLLFRAWDIYNNSSTSELSFIVDPNLEPGINVFSTQDPNAENTSFIISHDREGSVMDVTLEIFDTSGRKLYQKYEKAVPTGKTYVMSWNQMNNSGSRLNPGLYLYRISVNTNGSQKATQAKKIIIKRQ